MTSRSITLVLCFAAGCGGGGGAEGGSSDTGPAPTPTTDVADETFGCVEGWEGCPCHEGVCIEGLECLSNHCVAVPESPTSDPPGTSDAESTETTTPVEESSSGTPIDPTDASSSDGGPPPECVEGDTWCPDEYNAQFCVDGVWIVDSCADHCALIGYGANGCRNVDECNCNGHTDPTCAHAQNAYCVCREVILGEACEQDDVYDACFQDADAVVLCYGEMVPNFDDYEMDCMVAFEACE